MEKFILFYVYGDGDDIPRIVRNPPDNFGALLEEWRALDRRMADGADEKGEWDFVGDWLKSKGVDVIAAESVVYLQEGMTREDWLDAQRDAVAWQKAAQAYLARLGSAEYRAGRAAWVKLGRRESTYQHNPSAYHRELVRLLGANDENGFKALKMSEGYASAVGV